MNLEPMLQATILNGTNKNQSRCRNDATPRQCAVVGFETKYYIHALNLLHSPAPSDVTDGFFIDHQPTILPCFIKAL